MGLNFSSFWFGVLIVSFIFIAVLRGLKALDRIFFAYYLMQYFAFSVQLRGAYPAPLIRRAIMIASRLRPVHQSACADASAIASLQNKCKRSLITAIENSGDRLAAKAPFTIWKIFFFEIFKGLSARYIIRATQVFVSRLDGRNSNSFFHSFLINQPALIQLVLQQRPDYFTKSSLIVTGLYSLLGKSIFLTTGSTWQLQRRIVNIAFEGARLKQALRPCQPPLMRS